MFDSIKEYFDTEIEISGKLEELLTYLTENGWKHQKDNFWSPDLQIDIFLKGTEKLTLTQEAYCDPKLSGKSKVLENILANLTTKA